MKRTALLGVLAGIVALLFAAPALADYPPLEGGAKVNQSVTAPGASITVHLEASVLKNGQLVHIEAEAFGFILTTPLPAVDQEINIPVPAATPPGTYIITVSGTSPAGELVRFEIPIVVDPAAPAIQAGAGSIGAVAGDGALVGVVPGANGATAVKGLQAAKGQDSLAVAGSRTPAAVRVAGLSLLALLMASGLGAIGYTAIARLRR